MSQQPFPTGPFRVVDARASGTTTGRLRGRSLIAPVRGVRMRADDAGDLELRCRAIGLHLPGDAAFSHTTAAALWGLPLPRNTDLRDTDPRDTGPRETGPAQPVHVIGPAGRWPIDALATIPHEGLRPDETARAGDLRLTTVPRTWADCGAMIDDMDLVTLTDAVLALRFPPTSRPELAAALARSAGLRGRRALRRALELSRHFVDSPMETRTRLQLIASGFPCPLVGADLFDDRGCWIARPDLCWPALRIAIEYDGEHHRTSRYQCSKDIHRKESMEDVGWRSLVLLSDDVLRRWPLTDARLRDIFASRGVNDPATLPDEPDHLIRPRLVTPQRH